MRSHGMLFDGESVRASNPDVTVIEFAVKEVRT